MWTYKKTNLSQLEHDGIWQTYNNLEIGVFPNKWNMTVKHMSDRAVCRKQNDPTTHRNMSIRPVPQNSQDQNFGTSHSEISW